MHRLRYIHGKGYYKVLRWATGYAHMVTDYDNPMMSIDGRVVAWHKKTIQPDTYRDILVGPYATIEEALA